MIMGLLMSTGATAVFVLVNRGITWLVKATEQTDDLAVGIVVGAGTFFSVVQFVVFGGAGLIVFCRTFVRWVQWHWIQK
jgi:hypothetical protein